MRGGETMVEETIRLIKEAETEAEKIVLKAEDTAREILENAKSEVEALEKQNETVAREKAKISLEAAKKAGDSAYNEALAGVESEILALKALATQKEGEAVQEVIAQLV
jgi:vacuolar-type H+-ATPase subunit H